MNGLIQKLRFRISLCFKALFHGSLNPVIKLQEGIEIDLSTNKIIIPGSFNLHCNESLKVSSDKHLILESGKSDDLKRPGYTFSIWENPPMRGEDPYMTRPLLTKDGNVFSWLGIFDDKGKPCFPDETDFLKSFRNEEFMDIPKELN